MKIFVACVCGLSVCAWGLFSGLTLLAASPLRPTAKVVVGNQEAEVATETSTPDFSAEQLEFFEKEVRPILVNRCYECHGPEADEGAGGLRMASRKDLLAGGDSGPAMEPGDTSRTLLIEAIRYGERLQMPPDQKMPLEEIATLMRWVEERAPWPAEEDRRTVEENVFDLEARRAAHWAWQPLTLPAVPECVQSQWALDPLDHFVLHKLESLDLTPAAEVTANDWLRRVTFDLSGLPPTVEELQTFLGANRELEQKFSAGEIDAANLQQQLQAQKAEVVDRLLASPSFGERWARHWLDLVRFAETAGHEFDYPIHNAYQYRDYVIRALNEDVGFHRFAAEHIAGDLLPQPRFHREQKFNESILGTSFWYLGENNHAPVDVLGDEANRMDNQIDVFGKAFLGMTIACARCHDHKFDAISAADYHSIAGVLQSTRRDVATIDIDQKILGTQSQIQEKTRAANALLAEYLQLRFLDTAGTKPAIDTESANSEVSGETAVGDVGSVRRFPEANGVGKQPYAVDSRELLAAILDLAQERIGNGSESNAVAASPPTGNATGPDTREPLANPDAPGKASQRVDARSGAIDDESKNRATAAVDAADVDAGADLDADQASAEARWAKHWLIQRAPHLDEKSPMQLLVALSKKSPQVSLAEWWREFRNQQINQAAVAESFQSHATSLMPPSSELSSESVSGSWMATGYAFTAPAPGDRSSGNQTAAGPQVFLGQTAWQWVLPGVLDSGRWGASFPGFYRSPTFEITSPRIHLRMRGNDAKVRLVIDSYRMNQFSELLFAGCQLTDTHPTMHWRTMSGDIQKYLGHRAFIELVDEGPGDICVDEVWVGGENPATAPSPLLLEICQARESVETLEELTEIFQAIQQAATSNMLRIPADSVVDVSAQSGPADARRMIPLTVSAIDQALIRQWNLDQAWFQATGNHPKSSPEKQVLGEALAQKTAELKELQASVQIGPSVYVATAGTPEDQAIYIRGNHKNLGELAPRGTLQALRMTLSDKSLPDTNRRQPAVDREPSGRLALAQNVASNENPLTSRVITNRVWHHLMGRGLVATTDNFGVMGEAPTHPELLDYLAMTFMQDQWSIKTLIRRIVLSRTYAIGAGSAEAGQSDPANQWLHRAHVRRLEGESIRDSMLAISGRLDRKMYGPSVPTHVTELMQGRGRPESGPVDGDNRRSIYLEVRRNFLNPLMLVFDTPAPFSTMGNRNQSNVPAQSLTLLNDPLLNELAAAWAQRLLEQEMPADQRLQQMYLQALSREITPAEAAVYQEFLSTMDGSTPQEAWTAIAHSIFNLKEFIFLR